MVITSGDIVHNLRLVDWKNKIKRTENNEFLINLDKSLLKVFVRKHKLWGSVAAFCMLIYGTVQIYQYGFVWSGFIAATLLIIQALLGYNIRKKSSIISLKSHRTIASFIFIALIVKLIHIDFFSKIVTYFK